jgi:uncharacterized membrane protein YgcG
VIRRLQRVIATLGLLVAAVASADERILDFHSDIVVMQDGWIQVTETIGVRAEGDRIRRGIYRDFPTEYFDKLGNRYEIGFEPLTVLRNDAREDYHSRRIDRGWRVYFGHANRLVSAGVHTYTFRYRASRMLGFFDEHDELYWNVTGFEWAFPIDNATATVGFAFDVPAGAITHEAYTGPFGAANRDYTSRVDADGRAHFAATKPLSPVNGLTIVVGWPKGFVDEPTQATRVGWLLQDNLNLLIVVAGLVLLLAYYIPVWRRFGRDPEAGVRVTRYVPPDSFSPASLRYIRQMYYDDKVMTAAIVNLAVKGYLRIDVEEGSDGFLGIGKEEDKYSLVRTGSAGATAPMARGEQELYDALFAEGDVVVLEQDNHELLGEAKSAHRKSLSKDYNQHYFRWNVALNIPAVLIVIVSMLMAMRAGPTPFVVLVGVVMVVVLIFFSVIMKSPTLRGRRVLDEVLGFKDYLEVAEKDELNLRNPPEKTPQLFEAYLPYALALGVDQLWSEKFAAVLADVRQPDGSSYSPAWYHGSWDSSSLTATTSHFSSALNTAVTSSVSPPGSSSGGGGGGFSGGGGGGGGGGGW